MNLVEVYNFSRITLPPITTALFLIGWIMQAAKWLGVGLPARTYHHARSYRVLGAVKAWTIDYLPTQYLPLRYEPIFRITLFLLAFTPVHQTFLLSIFGASPNPAFATYGFPRALISTVFVVTGMLILFRWIVQYSNKHSLARPIAGASDFFGISLILLIAFTGILAAHGLANYLLMVTLHFISIQIFAIYLPFSKTAHVITGLVARTYYGVRRAILGV
ncbi:MAG: hypothetical protein QW390_01780 [Candidatus Bathyarchaeia archaeon]